jgi:hypothetical protein
MELYDDILEFTSEPCFPELHEPCVICGEPLYFINEHFTEACINTDCAYGIDLSIEKKCIG